MVRFVVHCVQKRFEVDHFDKQNQMGYVYKPNTMIIERTFHFNPHMVMAVEEVHDLNPEPRETINLNKKQQLPPISQEFMDVQELLFNSGKSSTTITNGKKFTNLTGEYTLKNE